jgi:L-rhamnonate dehydratase
VDVSGGGSRHAMISKSMTRRTLLAGAALFPRNLFGADDRIASVKATPHVLTGRTPENPKFRPDDVVSRAHAFGPFAQIPAAVLVEIRTTSGLTGFGLGGGGAAAVMIIEQHLRELLVGEKTANIDSIWSELFSATSFYGRRGLAVMAISGIDLALWDIAGKAARKPVCELLGGKAGHKVATYYTGANMVWAAKQGFRAFKLPVSSVGSEEGDAGLKRLEKMVAEARAATGPTADLMLDCLCRWDIPFTLRAVERLAQYRIRWFEEPLLPDDYDGYAELCRRVRGTQISSGEHEYTHFGFAELIGKKAVHIVQPDISWSGGLTDLRKIADLALRQKLTVVPHRGGSLYGLHFIAGTPGCDLAESFGLGENGTDVMKAMTPPFQDGFLVVPDKPGFGVELPG